MGKAPGGAVHLAFFTLLLYFASAFFQIPKNQEFVFVYECFFPF